MAKIYSEVYGCSSNLSDYEIMLGLLKEGGFEHTTSQNKSDLNLLVTCTVKEPTEKKMINRVSELSKSSKPLIIAGCMAKTGRRLIEKINPRASLLGPNSIENVVDVARSTLEKNKMVVLEDTRRPKLCLPKLRKNSTIDIVQISDGCAWQQCTYCIVKFARGKLFSYPLEMIVKEISSSVKKGCKEVWLTSQDTACYGIDIKTNLAELLEKICDINGKFFVRVGMMNPVYAKNMIDGLVEIYKNEKIFKFIHMPVQSGSDSILSNMKRGYTSKDFLDCIRKFRKEISNTTLSTDIIVGYPTEGDSEFKETVKMIKKARPDITNISKFGAREGTEASKMKKLDVNTVSERSKILHDLTRKIALEKNKEWVGWSGEILVDEAVENAFQGRNFAYKQVILKEKSSIGIVLKVKIVDATANFLVGKLY